MGGQPPPAGEYRRLLTISLPLAASTVSTMVMQFMERVYLGGHSLEAMAAVMPAGVAVFLCGALFLGAASYLGVFVAQYVGAGQPGRVGAVVWAGVYFSLLAGLVLAGASLAAEDIFALVGHDPEIQRLEAAYFRVLTLGGALGLLGPALATFFSGRGLTRPVMLANLAGTASFAPLGWVLINGWGPLPALGILGAALATLTAWGVTAGVLALMIKRVAGSGEFGLRRGRAWDSRLMLRLMRFGLPSGLQFFLEVSAIACFVFWVGRIGKDELAVTNMVMTVDSMAFVPLLGFSVGVSTLVGQAVGRCRPEQAVAVARAGMRLAFAYLGLVSLVFLLIPESLLGVFRPRHMEAEAFAPLLSSGVMVLRMMACYRLASGLGIVCIGALRGAGDIRFLLGAMAVELPLLLALPLYLGVELAGMGLAGAWACFIGYLLGLSLTLYWRFRSGGWRGKLVVEG